MPQNSTAMIETDDYIDVSDGTMAEMILQGLPYSEIAKALNIGKSTVTRRLSKPITRQIVQTTISALSLYAPKVARRLIEMVDDDDRNIRLKAISEYNKIMGLSHAHASVVIQEMYVDQRTQVLSPSLVGLLGAGEAVQTDDEGIIDVEAE